MVKILHKLTLSFYINDSAIITLTRVISFPFSHVYSFVTRYVYKLDNFPLQSYPLKSALITLLFLYNSMLMINFVIYELLIYK